MLSPTQKHQVAFLIRRYCERMEANKAKIHYRQYRPMTHLGRSPNREMTLDCSGYVTSAFFWADLFTPFKVEDPNGVRYNGTGYTGTLLATNRTRRVPLDRKFFVGDMALYGPSLGATAHVAICRKNGDVNSSVWSSHGSEGGPYAVRLKYRRDLLCVVRSKTFI